MPKRIGYIYHHNDPDGHVAGYIAKKTMMDLYGIEEQNIRTLSKDYTATFTDHFNEMKFEDDDHEIYLMFVDLCFTEKTIGQLITAHFEQHVVHTTWIDHHASSHGIIEEIRDYGFDRIAPVPDIPDPKIDVSNFDIVFDTQLCGAALTYVWSEATTNPKPSFEGTPDTIRWIDFIRKSCNDSNNSIRIVLHDLEYGSTKSDITFIGPFLWHLDNQDRWTGEDPDSDKFIDGLKVFGWDLERNGAIYTDLSFDDLFSPHNVDYSKRIIEVGEIANKFKMQEYAGQDKYINIIEINGCRVGVKNGHGNSRCFQHLVDKYLIDVSILFRYDPKADLWVHSIYSYNEAKWKVNKIANIFGGGGHPGAAGFQIKDPLFTGGEKKIIENMTFNYHGVFNAFAPEVPE